MLKHNSNSINGNNRVTKLSNNIINKKGIRERKNQWKKLMMIDTSKIEIKISVILNKKQKKLIY